ncbi:hypothetical protein BDN72DRAFT_882903 [Pluteus cervinus]|uniref:Uncharacterized protein n=1 Tax=Pluteus cervinus TaxID=181527 RepID=A0ACD3A8E7_9AGAR|nr:hypothetical protein BDN72DRAFT_882903 [Pluteus cervinus]
MVESKLSVDLSNPLVFSLEPTDRLSRSKTEKINRTLDEYTKRFTAPQAALLQETPEMDRTPPCAATKAFLKVALPDGSCEDVSPFLRDLLSTSITPDYATAQVQTLGHNLHALMLDISSSNCPEGDTAINLTLPKLDALILKIQDTALEKQVNLTHLLSLILLQQSTRVKVAISCGLPPVLGSEIRLTHLMLNFTFSPPKPSGISAFWDQFYATLSDQGNLTHFEVILPADLLGNHKKRDPTASKLSVLSITAGSQGTVHTALKACLNSPISTLSIRLCSKQQMRMDRLRTCMGDTAVSGIRKLTLGSMDCSRSDRFLEVATSLSELCWYCCSIGPAPFKECLYSFEFWYCHVKAELLNRIRDHFNGQGPGQQNESKRRVVIVEDSLGWQLNGVMFTENGMKNVVLKANPVERDVPKHLAGQDLFLRRGWRWFNGKDVNSDYDIPE